MPITGTPEQRKQKVFQEFKAGTLNSGRGGPIVKNRKQAIAIALSEERRPSKKRKPKRIGPMLKALLVIAALFAPAVAQADPGTLLDCSGTATNSSAAITFSHRPQNYLYIGNPHGTNVLWINPVGGNAAANTAGSQSIAAGASIAFDGRVQPGAVKIIAPAGNTAYTCWYQ